MPNPVIRNGQIAVFLMPNSACAFTELKTVELRLIIHALNDYFLKNGHSTNLGKKL